jgi:hypothetical protein
MNFIVARLLEVMKEEEAFWTLCQLSEALLPVGYYSNLLGVLIDIKVFDYLLSRKMSKLLEHMESANPPFTVTLLAFNWFLTIFINHLSLPIETEYRIWDIFFIQGDSALFSVALTLAKLMEKKIMAVSRFE